MSRRYRERAVTRHWVYDRAGLQRAFGVEERTISNWIKRGLRPIDDRRPQLFAAHEIQRFVRLHNAGRKTFDRKGRILCRSCGHFMRYAVETVIWVTDALKRERLRTDCPKCASLVEHHYAAENAAVLRRRLAQHAKPTGNTSRNAADCSDGGVPSSTASSGLPVGPETCSANLRLLHRATTDWTDRDQLNSKSINERLRALARLSSFHGNKPFGEYSKSEAIRFRDALAEVAHADGSARYSQSTIVHTLDHCRSFFAWLAKQRDYEDLQVADYLRPTKTIRRIAAVEGVKDAIPWRDVLHLFSALPKSSPIERRNRAIVALIALTGMRADAVASMPRIAINWPDRSVDQGVAGMRTKNSNVCEPMSWTSTKG